MEIAADSKSLIACVIFINVSKSGSVIRSHVECAGAIAKNLLNICIATDTKVKAVNIIMLLSK